MHWWDELRFLLQVLESWRVILRGAPMDIRLEDVRVCARDGAAFVTCTEIMEAGDSRGRCLSGPSTYLHACLLRTPDQTSSITHAKQPCTRNALASCRGVTIGCFLYRACVTCIQQVLHCDDVGMHGAGVLPPMCLRGRTADG